MLPGGTWQPCRTEAVREAALPSRPGPDRHSSVSYQAEQQIHHLHQIEIDQRGSMHGSGKCLPWKLRSWTLPAIKRLVPGYGCHPDSHPTISETQPTRPDLSEPFLLQRGWEGFCLEVWIVVLRCGTLVWAQVHGKMRRNAEGHKAISKTKAGGGRNRDAEGHRLRTGALPPQTSWMDWTGREQKSTTGRLSLINTELGCGSNSGRVASSCWGGSASGLTCAD